MAWNYKGIEIEMRGEKFYAAMDDTAIVKPSLAAAKREIDKRLDAKAKLVTLNLPVVVLRVSFISEDDEKRPDIIEKAIITGVDESNRILGIASLEGYRTCYALPYSVENAKILADYRHHQTEERRLRNIIESLNIPTRFDENRRYAECVEIIQKQHSKEVVE